MIDDLYDEAHSGFAPPYILDSPSFESFIKRRINQIYKEQLDLDSGQVLSVKVFPPDIEEIKVCKNVNLTLNGTLEIRWSSSDKPLQFVFPYPVEGVFIIRSNTSLNGGAQSWIWHSRLVGQPGLKAIRKVSDRKGSNEKYVRYDFMNCRYRTFAFDDEMILEKTDFYSLADPFYGLYILTNVLGDCNDPHADLIAKVFSPLFPSGIISANKNNTKKIAKCFDVLIKDYIGSDPFLVDEQDLKWQRLYTYSAFLAEKIIGILLFQLDVHTKSPKNGKVKENSADFWNLLLQAPKAIVPTAKLISSGRFHLFNPINGIEAVSRLSSFQRYPYSKATLDRLPPIFRQNHPSFQGAVCPVESPESLKVGISLNLARNVQTDVIGRIIKPETSKINEDLGHAASLVPFYQHNDSPRAMMGAKNLKQAVPVRARSIPSVTTGHEVHLRKSSGKLKACRISESDFAVDVGVDLLVAYMPWYGWNVDDAIVANKQLVSNGSMDWVVEQEFFEYLLPDFRLFTPVFDNTFEEAFKVLSYEKSGIRKLGPIRPGDPVAFFKDITGSMMLPVLCGAEDSGELVAIDYSPPPFAECGGSLSWKIRHHYPLKVGDKIMGRHGNKGIVAKILPSDAMPHLPDDDRLPEGMRGKSVDLILNPHGVISRMNLGQLLETSIGMLIQFKNKDFKFPKNIGRAFAKVDIAALETHFLSLNRRNKEPLFDKYGRVHMILPDGQCTAAPVTVGIQHMVRLKHVADRKAQVRAGARKERNRYSYNLISGQPVGGRRRKGGQRIGEMEVWALAAHNATKNLKSILEIKSDPGEFGTKQRYGQTFQAIKDHLYAMGIEIEEASTAGLKLKWANTKDIEAYCRPVSNHSCWSVGAVGNFSCGVEKCNYRLPLPSISTGNAQRQDEIRLTINDLLASKGLQLPVDDPITIPVLQGRSAQGELVVQIIKSDTKKKKRKCIFHYKRGKRSISVDFSVGQSNYSAYKQNDTPSQALSIQQLGQFWLTCPFHKTKILSEKRHRLIPVGERGGLCDESIFGGTDLSNWNADSFGYIRLNRAAPYPGIMKGDSSKLNLKSGVLKLVDGCLPPDIEVVPILPLKYRFRAPKKIGVNILPLSELLTARYSKLVRLVKQNADENLIQNTYLSIYGIIYNRLFGKMGLIRRSGLGRRVDMSARLVIVPDPTLDWDVCGVPIEVLMVLLGPRISKDSKLLSEFVRVDGVDELIKAIFNVDLQENRVPEAAERLVLSQDFWSEPIWPNKALAKEHLFLAGRIISRYLDLHPHTTVLLNRQPSLHRFSFMGFKPKVLDPDDGMVLKINPLVCNGFGADFDGDEMALHLPMTDDEMREAEAMMPTKSANLFSDATGQPMAHFDQDFVAGHFYLSLSAEGRNAITKLLSPLKCADCDNILDQSVPWKKKHGQDLIAHLCLHHPLQAPPVIKTWMNLAYKVLTEQGLSFGFLELWHLRRQISEHTNGFLKSVDNLSDPKVLSTATGAFGNQLLAELENKMPLTIESPGFGLTAMAISGARGTKQVRQLIGARGWLDPGAIGFEPRGDKFFCAKSLVEGVDKEESFFAAMNGRSSMLDKKLGTGRAGYLTRRLVLAGWEWHVHVGDCGADRSADLGLVDCQWQDRHTICSTCYGDLPGGRPVPDGYPAGLIAAQSFGERGTQLSMQSFHTAEKQLSINEVVALLGGRDPEPDLPQKIEGGRKFEYNWFVDKADVPKYLERIRRENGYKQIDKRHLFLIWLIIHRSPRKSLSSAWHDSHSPLGGMVGPYQWRALLRAICSEQADDLTSPVVKLLISKSPT